MPKDVQAYFAKIAEPRRTEALQIYQFIREAVPSLEPHVVKGFVGFGRFHYKGRTCEGEWFKVGMGCNKSSTSVYSCASNDKGMLAEQAADRLGKVTVGRSCIRFKKWSDVDHAALRRLLKESEKAKFAFE
jgi:hypothetical protein